MPSVGEVSFELERFEWTVDDRLVVVGRWNGVRGRRIARPALTVDTGGRRQRLSGHQESEEPWSASFDWSGDDIAGAELEIGRSLVVELPPPRRRRRRSGASAESDLRAQLDDLRAERAAELCAERDRLAAVEADRDRLAAELAEAGPAERLAEVEAKLAALRERQDEPVVESGQELAGLRLAHGSLKAAHEALEDELEALRDERDELTGRVEQLESAARDADKENTRLGELIRALETAREGLSADLAVAREELARLEHTVAERDRSLSEAQRDAARRIDTERATTTEVHARLATAREEAEKSMVAEAEETEVLRAELERARDESERRLAAERAEVARLREELLSSEVDEGAEEASRRMVERITRDLERERATSRNLKRELDTLRSDTAEQRRQLSASTANGTLAMDGPPAAGARAARAVRTPEGTQRRVEAARQGASQRVPKVPPSPYALWAVRIGAALLVAVLAVALVAILMLAT